MADLKILTAAAAQANLNYGRLAIAAGSLYFGNASNVPVEVANSNHNHDSTYEPKITKGNTSQYFRGDMSLATFPTTMTPTSHASAATTYGVATTSNYGHVKIGAGLTVTTGLISLTSHAAATSVTGAKTLAVADANKTFLVGSASAITVTIPLNSSAAIPIGSHFDFIRTGAGDVTIGITAGVTLNSEGNKRKINAQYQAATLIKTDTDTWYLIGALKT